MSNNLTRKGLAVSSGLAIALTSLVGVAPATAAAGDVTIAPTYGNTWAVFNSDEFEFDTNLSPAVAVDADWWDGGGLFEGSSPIAYQLTNADGQAFRLDLPADYGSLTEDASFDFIAFDSRGIQVDANGLGEGLVGTINFEEDDAVIDFDDLGATRVHIYDIDDQYAGMGDQPAWELGLQPVVWDSTNSEYDTVGYGDGDFSVGVKSWFEVAWTVNYASVEAAYASSAQTINFFDPATVSATPRIERFVSGDYTYHFNGDYYEDGQSTDVSFSVAFSKDVNLDQVDLYDWSYDVVSSSGDYNDSAYLGEDYVYLSGTEDLDDAARLYVESDAESYAEDSYRVTIQYGEDTDNRKFTSGGYQPPLGSEDADELEFTANEVTNQNQEDSEDSYFEARSGTKSITYTAQLMDTDVDASGVALKEAGVPVLMVLWSGYEDGDENWETYLAEDATLSVTGANLTLTTGDAAVVASGVTDANGKVNFTVTHSSATATEGYYFDLYYADEDGDFIYSTNGNVEYVNTAVSEIEADSEIVAGSKVDLTFTVTDQFAQPIAKRGTTALNVELTSSNGEDLDLSAAVAANGEAKFSFNNFLSLGETDVLTAQVLAGTTAIGVSTTVDIYNSPAAASVSAAASVETVVSYADYITGTASATNVAPDNGDGAVITGTVLDASGAGIAGAVATVSGAGLQFRKADSGAYAKDTITVVADTNGQFSVRVWAQKVSSTGHVVTLTSGGKSTTTKVITYLPSDLSGDNLHFSFANLPSYYVKNTTYAVSVKLTDKWGNPVQTATGTDVGDLPGVTFEGTGAVEINSSGDAVNRNTNSEGIATVYLRSVTDVVGLAGFTAYLNEADYRTGDGTNLATLSDLGANTNSTSTAWDESTWTRELEKQVEVLNVAPSSTRVNVGSFNGKLVVYAAGLKGKTISWKVGGNWGKAVATSDFARFDRPTPRRGVQLNVQIFVDGAPVLSKVVTTR